MQNKDSVGEPTLNVLFISFEKNLLNQKQGDALERHLRYAKDVDSLDVIVLTTKKDGYEKTLQKNNLSIIPTNSRSRWTFIWDALMKVNRLKAEKKLHIVSTQDPFVTAIAGIVIKMVLRTRLNIQIHNDYDSKYWKKESLQNQIFSIFLPLSLRFSDSIRAVSQLTAKIVRNQSKVFIAPISVDIKYFVTENKQNKKYDLISIGRLVKQKNFPLLINAFYDLVKIHPNLKLAIVGKGPLKNEIKFLIKKLGLKDNIDLIGEVDRSLVRTLLQKSKLFILTSNYEGWGLVAIEAGASGLPVIMTDTGGAQEIIDHGKTGLIVPVNNKEALVNTALTLIEDENKARKVGLLAKKRIIKKFEDDKQDQFIFKLINSVNIN